MEKFEVKTENALWVAYKVGPKDTSRAWRVETCINGVHLSATTPENWAETRVFQFIISLYKSVD